MKLTLLVLSLFVLLLGSTTLVFAETTYQIKIPSGASDENAPYFWSEKSTGVTTGEITVFPGDSVTWNNADTAFHTITSVTQSGDEDGLFDSGFFTAGESFTRQFDTLGDFYYYCSLHPWMNGVVHVVKNTGSVKTIHNVASGYTDDGLGFDVKYILDTNLQQAVFVNTAENTLTFKISGDTEMEQITIILPVELIENPSTVMIDGVMTDFQTDDTATGTMLTISMEPHSEEIKIIGTHVIPEFGFLALGILGVGMLSTLFLIRTRFYII